MLTLLMMLAAPPAARAELQFDVFPGLDGQVAAGGWFPIACEVFNDGPGFNGVIEVNSTYGRGGRLLVPVELPTNTRKRLFLPAFAPSGGYHSWDVRLLDERQRTRAEHLRMRPTRDVSGDSHLIAALPRSAAGLPVLPPLVENRNQLQPGVARLTPDFVPDNPLLLEGVSAFYLNAQRAPELKAPQIAALLAWLNLGGHLIVSVEQAGDVNSTPWLRNLLPCTLGSGGMLKPRAELHRWLPNPSASTVAPELQTPAPATNTVVKKKNKSVSIAPGRLPALAPDERLAEATLNFVTATPRGAEVLLAIDGHPLILHGRVQRGRVTVLAFDPEREPFLGWSHRAWFWVRAAGLPTGLWARTDSNVHRGRHLDAVFGTVVESRQVGKLPFLALLAILLGYLLVIGPGERYALKRLRREMWTWITFPLIVAGFSMLIYFIGYKLRAGDTEWNELHVVDVLRRGEGAMLRGRTYGSVYSSGNQRYRFQTAAGGAGALRGEAHAGGGGGFATEDSRIVSTGDSVRADLRVPVWTSQLLAHDWFQPSPAAPLEFTVRAERDQWNVEVHNRLSRRVQQGRVMVGGVWYDLGVIAAGEKKQFSLSKNTGSNLSSFVRNQWPLIESAVNARQSSFRSGDEQIVGAFDAVCAASFHSLSDQQQGHLRYHTLTGFDLGDALEKGDAVLLAWAPDHAAQPPLNQFPAPRSGRQTVFRLVTTPTSAATP